MTDPLTRFFIDMIRETFKATITLLDYLFVENCRICHRLIVEGSSPAQTVCCECWAPLEEQEARIDFCAISGTGAIKVAHAASYEDSMKTLIYKLKYYHDRLVARDLSLLLFKAYCVIKDVLPDSTTAKLVPIPLSRWRMMQRGFNQAELLAKHIQQGSDVPVLTKLLIRRKHTRPQHKLNKQDRENNLRDAFKCSALNLLPEETSIILVDDIHTSGSTLAEAARALSLGGAKHIAAITVARALLK